MEGPQLLIGVYGHAMINLSNENIIVIGGSTGPNLKQTFVYNQNLAVWSWGPALNQARFNHAVGIVTDEATQEKFVVVTGGKNLDILNSTEILMNGIFSLGKNYSFLNEKIQGLRLFSALDDSFLYMSGLRPQAVRK